TGTSLGRVVVLPPYDGRHQSGQRHRAGRPVRAVAADAQAVRGGPSQLLAEGPQLDRDPGRSRVQSRLLAATIRRATLRNLEPDDHHCGLLAGRAEWTRERRPEPGRTTAA